MPTLRGTTVVTLFYEASTRTRSSFELAARSLGADVINIAASGSSIEKGESLVDTVRTLQAVGADMLVMRHRRSGAPYLVARHVNMSVVNAGDGWHAHPTQALLDVYTIASPPGRPARPQGGHRRRYHPQPRGALQHLGPDHDGRPRRPLRPADAPALGPAPRPARATKSWGLPSVEVEPNLDRAIEGADVVMCLRLQLERQQAGLLPSIREYARLYQVNEERLARARPERAGHAPRARSTKASRYRRRWPTASTRSSRSR